MGETPPSASLPVIHNLNCNIMDPATQASKTNSAAVAFLTASLFLLSGPPVIAGDGTPEEPPGYRMDDYRAPVPETVAGATTVSTQQLKAMIDAGGVVLVDVLPAPRKPPNMLPGVPWMPVPHRNIPGSIWLPEVGRGKIPVSVNAYFRDNLAKAAGDDKARPIVIYCRIDCWMSWNAAKRAASYGYTAIHWYPMGIEGWEFENLPLEVNRPVP
jgi:PQQ-dependent catabolism-associated CXXCW motif protein